MPQKKKKLIKKISKKKAKTSGLRIRNVEISEQAFVIFSIANLFLLFLIFFFLKFFYFSNILTPIFKEDFFRKNYIINNFIDDSDQLSTDVVAARELLGHKPIIDSLDPSLGQTDARVNVVYFNDLACKYCIEQEQILKKVLKKYPDSVRLVWKDYPTDHFSFQASIAARCAQKQDQFWEYTDIFHKFILDNQKLDDDIFLEIAQNLDLDLEKFQKCFENLETNQLVEDNIIEANVFEIIGVPSLFVNAYQMMGAIGQEELEQIINQELN